MTDPVIASDKITYEREAIELWMKLAGVGMPIRSPITNEELTTTALVSNVELKNKLVNVILTASSSNSEGKVANIREALYSLHIETIPELSRALSSNEFEALDALMHLDLMTRLNLQAPQVIVIGSENHGKSTLLERLIGLPIFPRYRTLCTCCRIRVKLRRQTAMAISKIYVRNLTTNTVDESTVENVALEMMCNRVKARMDEMLVNRPHRSIISDREIVIEIRVPYCPNIDILDMPGLVAAPKESAEMSLELSRSTIINEKAHSIFLLVVDSRTECTASIATRLVQDLEIAHQTIGVFTKMDIFFNEYDGCPGNKEEMFNIYTDESNPGYVPLPKGWMGCASLPNLRAEARPMERLLLAERKELAMLRDDFSTLFKSNKVGMVAIRDCVQREFEQFLCDDWVHRIDTHLKERFLYLSDHNANLGMPMAPLATYIPHLQNLLPLVPQVFPDFQVSMLEVTTTHVFKDILTNRVKIVCANCSKWMRFGESAVWATITDTSCAMVDKSTEWNTAAIDFVKCLHVADAAKTLVLDALHKIVRELKSEAAALGGMFMSRMQDNERRPTRNLFSLAYTFLLSAFRDEDQPEVCKLERFPKLVEAYRLYIDAAINTNTKKFEEEANNYINKIHDVVVIEYRPDTTNVVASLRWRDDTDAHFNNILSIYLRETLGSLPTLTQSFIIPSQMLQEEECAAERTKLLAEMSDIATALISLKRLIDRVTEGKPKEKCPKEE